MSTAPTPRRAPKRKTLLSTGVALWFLSLGMILSGVTTLSWLAADPAMLFVAGTLGTLATGPFVGIVLYVDRHEKEPWWLLLAAFVWGALVATMMSAPFNQLGATVAAGVVGDPDVGWFLSATLVAPTVEEFTKGMALFLVFTLYVHHADDVLDGIVYGAIVGLGFAWFENVAYYMDASTDGLGRMVELFAARGLLQGLGSHATFTALTGLGFGLHRVARGAPWGWFMPALGLVAAITAHTLWNGVSGLFVASADGLVVGTAMAVVWLQLPFLLFIGLAALLALRHQEVIILAHLGDEPDDVVLDVDLARLVPARRRLWRGFALFFARGPLTWWRHALLTQALIQLAFARWHHAADDQPWTPDEDADVQRWRDQVRQLRALGVRP